jgi:transposase
MTISTIGLDIAKSVFQVHAIDAVGRVMLRKRLPRAKVLDFFRNLDPCLVGIEACATSHFWAREIGALGHRVRLMPAQYVKPYVKRHKNDMTDAEAICEAVQRPNMRFVEPKSAEQQGVATLHNARGLLVKMRILIGNTIRAHIAEFGVIAAKGRIGLDSLLDLLADDCEQRIPALAKEALKPIVAQLERVKQEILEMDRRILKLHRSNELSLRLATIPGVGPITATRFIAAVPDPTVFKSGRALAAWIGLTPKQNSSGGKERLGEISRAGNQELRQLLVCGATTVIQAIERFGYIKHPWLHGLLERRPKKVATVALANKMARIIWALMMRGDRFRPHALSYA